jgi:predicted small metal-binding protein
MNLLSTVSNNPPAIPIKYPYADVAGIMPGTTGSSFRCQDIGIDCPFEAHGSTRQELMKKFIEHAGPLHNMQVLSADVIFKVHNAIK